MSLIFLAVPSLLIGISGYYSSTRSLNKLGAKGLQTNVRMTIEMIEALDKQVKAGKIPLKEAQEQVKEAILGKKDNRGKRPINPRLTKEKMTLYLSLILKGLNSHTQILKERMYGI